MTAAEPSKAESALESDDGGQSNPELDDDVIRVATDQQLHAIGNLVRHRILRLLRDGPATVTQIAARLGVAKGSSNYHVKVLAKAGFIRVVETRKVRGVTELYYGSVGKLIELPDSGGSGEPEHMMRNALADVEAAPPGAAKDMRLKYLRLSEADFDLACAKLHALHDEIAALHDPEQPSADFFYVLYRPQDSKQNPENQPLQDVSPEPGTESVWRGSTDTETSRDN